MLKRAIALFLATLLAANICTGIVSAITVTESFAFEESSKLEQWNRLGDPNGSLSITNGELQLTNASAYSEVCALYNKETYTDFTAEFTFRFSEGKNNDAAMFLYRANADASQGYAVYFVHCPDADKQYYIKFTSRPYTELKSGLFFNNNEQGIAYDSDVQVKVVVSGGTHSLYVAMPGQEYGDPIYTYTEQTPLYASGYVGFMQWHDGGSHQVTTAFDDLVLTTEKDEPETPTEPETTVPPVGEDATITFETIDGWERYGVDSGTMAAVNGELQLGSATAYSEVAALYTAGGMYEDFAAEFTFRFSEGKNNDAAMFLYRANADASQGYAVYFVRCPDADKQYYIKFTSRPYTELKSGLFFNNNEQGIAYDSDVQVKVVVSGGTHSLYVAMPGQEYGDPIYTYTEQTPLYASGYAGFMQWHDGGSHQVTTAFDDLVLTTEKTEPEDPEATEPEATVPPVGADATVTFETIDGWEYCGTPDGTMSAVNGELHLDSKAPNSEASAVYTGGGVYDNFYAEFTYRFASGENNDSAMFLYRASADASTGYAVYFVHCPDDANQYYIKFTSRPYAELKSGLFFNNAGNGVPYDKDVKVKVSVYNGTHKLYVAMPNEKYGAPVFTYTEKTPLYSSGYVGFMQWHDAGTRQVTAVFDDLKIKVGKDNAVDPAPDNVPVGITYSNDFASTSTLNGWEKFGEVQGSMRVANGNLLLSSNVANSETAAVYKKSKYRNFTAEFTYHFEAGSENDAAMFLYGANADASTGYGVYFVHCPDDHNQYYIKLASRPYNEMKSGLFYNDDGNGVAYNEDIRVKIIVKDGAHRLYVAKPGEDFGAPIYVFTEETAKYPVGYVGFMQWHDAGTRHVAVAFDDFSINNSTEIDYSLEEGLEDDYEEPVFEVGTLLWESNFAAGSLEDAGLEVFYSPKKSKAEWNLFDYNGIPALHGQIAKFDDTIVRLSGRKYQNCTIEASVVLERGNAIGVIGRLQDDGRGYSVILDQHDGVKLCERSPYLAWKTGGVVEQGTEYHVVLSMYGNTIKAKITNTRTMESVIHEITNDAVHGAGYIGFSVYGYDNDAVSTASAIFKNVKVYYGAVDLNSLNPERTSPNPSGSSETTPDNDANNGFFIVAKYLDVKVDNDDKVVTVLREMTVAELKDAFDSPRGYGVKVVGKNGQVIVDETTIVTDDMKLVYFSDGAEDQIYAITMNKNTNTIWIIVGITVLGIIGISVATVIILRKKKKR